MNIRIVERNDNNGKSFVIQRNVEKHSSIIYCWEDVSAHTSFDFAEQVVFMLYKKVATDKVIKEYDF
jgi:hypothetical protein